MRCVLGVLGDVFAAEIEPGFDALVRSASALRVAPSDLVLYHHGIACPPCTFTVEGS